MGCNCGGKKARWQNAILPAQQVKAINEYKAANNIPLSQKIDIHEMPDELLTPIQLRSKQRHFRIIARQKRIEQRNKALGR